MKSLIRQPVFDGFGKNDSRGIIYNKGKVEIKGKPLKKHM